MRAHQALAARGTEAVGQVETRWLLLAWGAWVVAAILAIVIVAAGIAPRLAVLQTVSSPRIPQQLRPWEARLFQESGLGVLFYAAYSTALEAVSSLVWVAVAAVLYWRRSADRMALVAAFTLVAFATSMNGFPDTLAASVHAWRLPLQCVNAVGLTAVTVFGYLFPSGRCVPRWTKPLALLVPPAYAALYLDPSLNPKASVSGLLLMALLYGSGVVAQIYRYRRVSSRVERQQTKWVVFAIGGMITGMLALVVVYEISAVVFTSNALGYVTTYIVGYTLFTACKLLIPLSIGIAILRYRLWDIDLILNRTLVYGALTASVIGLYVLIVGGLGALLQTQGNPVLSLLAAALVAVLFQPLRTRLQRGVNRLMYGERDEPYAVVALLGQRLENTLAPDDVLPTIIETLIEALKLPYAAIALRQQDGLAIVASSGTATNDSLHLPLVYQNDMVGELLLAPRAPGESFTPSDERLLRDLARHAGIAAHAVQLTADLQRVNADLQRSRARLVTAREEERRRLRRDLHDGLGAALTSLTFGLDTASNLLSRDPDAGRDLLHDLKTQAKAAIADIRRLVYDLRPPALDELGLAGALREQVSHYQLDGTRVALHVPDVLPPLPAAVEVAAYRIVLEALANVIRHAQAHTCTIHLDMSGDALGVEVRDDGVGLPLDYHAGVGMMAMRERAAELGGSVTVESMPSGGTCIQAQLPHVPE